MWGMWWEESEVKQIQQMVASSQQMVVSSQQMVASSQQIWQAGGKQQMVASSHIWLNMKNWFL